MFALQVRMVTAQDTVGTNSSQDRTIDEGLEGLLTQTGLVLAGPLALLAATAATFLFWRRVRMRVAVPCVVLACMPALTLAVLFTHVLGCVRNWW